MVPSWIVPLAVAFAVTTALTPVRAQPAPTPGGAPVAEQPVWPSLESLQAQLQRWQEQHPRVLAVETLGQSLQGRPLLLARLTDPGGDVDQKECALITALHSGAERTGATGAFRLMEWLLSDDPEARETLRRQVILVMPVPNPDGYVSGSGANAAGKALYNEWTPAGPPDPEQNPEGVAVQQVMDRYQPELHADLHGLDLSFPGHIMTESSGGAWSNSALRPYHQGIMRLMDEAAREGGYPSEALESDAERLPWGPDLNAIAPKLWVGRPRYYAGTYAYDHFHSLTCATEVCWEESGLLRHQRLLRIGNEVWPGELHAGYPTRVVSKNEFHSVVAYGQSAAARRRSRVELWNKQSQLTHGMINPQREGLVLYVCAPSPAECGKWLADTSLKGFLDRLGDNPAVDAEAVREALSEYPDGPGQWGERAALYMVGDGAAATGATPIEHGLSLRLSIPYPKAHLTDVRVNGHPVARSETDGYVTWVARAYTYIQVNIPPERARAEGFFVVTCKYDPGETRRRWRPE